MTNPTRYYIKMMFGRLRKPKEIADELVKRDKRIAELECQLSYLKGEIYMADGEVISAQLVGRAIRKHPDETDEQFKQRVKETYIEPKVKIKIAGEPLDVSNEPTEEEMERILDPKGDGRP